MAAKESRESFTHSVRSRQAAGTKRQAADRQVGIPPVRVDAPATCIAEEWERTFDAVSELVAILDMQHRIVRVNRAMAARLGLTKEQCVGQTCYHLVHGADEPPSFCPHVQLLADGNNKAVEVREKRLAGDFFVTVSPLRDSTGQLTGCVHVARDITERKRVEEALQIQHDLALALAATQNLDDAFRLCVDATIRAAGMDAGALSLVDRSTGSLDMVYWQGLSSEFVAEVSHYDADSPEASLVAKGLPVYAQHRELGIPLSTAERNEGLRAVAVVPVLHEGSVIACLNIASHTQDEISTAGRSTIEAIAASIGGAIARLQAEQALRESEQRFRTLFEDAPDPIYLNDLQGNFLDGNRAAEEITGYKREELIGKNMFHLGLLTPADLTRASENIAKGVAGRPTGPDEFTLKRKDGSLATLEIRTFPMKTCAQRAVLGIARDITERRRAEQALRESQQRFHDLAELLPQTVFEMDPERRLTFVNQESLETFGYSKEEALAPIDALDLLDPGEHDRARRNLDQILRGIPSRGNEYLARRKDGSLFPVLVCSARIVCNGRPVGIRGTILDITERKRVEQQVTQERDKAKTYLEIAGVILVALDAEGRVTLMNRKGCEILGVSQEEALGKPWCDEFVPVQDRERTRQCFTANMTGDLKLTEYFENAVLTKQGERREIAWHNRVLRDEHGGIVGTLSSGEDVTERNCADKALRLHFLRKRP